MLVHLRFYGESILTFCSWTLDPKLQRASSRFFFKTLDFSIQIFRLEDLEDPKVFNYFYLLRFFFGHRACVRSVKKHFVLGKHYQNVEIGFCVRAPRFYMPMSVWIYQVQSMANLQLTRDYVLDTSNFRWLLRDLSIFSEKKTNAGLFYLEDPLAITLHFRLENSDIPLIFYKQLLRSLKILL